MGRPIRNNCWPLGQSPRFVVISPDAKYAFVSGHLATGVATPVLLKTGTATARADTRSRSRAPRPIPVQGAPSYIAIKAGSVAS